jgi:hypothetical protein
MPPISRETPPRWQRDSAIRAHIVDHVLLPGCANARFERLVVADVQRLHQSGAATRDVNHSHPRSWITLTTHAMIWQRYESSRMMGMIPGGASATYGARISSTQSSITLSSIHAFSSRVVVLELSFLDRAILRPLIHNHGDQLVACCRDGKRNGSTPCVVR